MLCVLIASLFGFLWKYRRLEHLLKLLKVGVFQFFSEPLVFLARLWGDVHPWTLAQRRQCGYLLHVSMRVAKALGFLRLFCRKANSLRYN